MSAIESNTNEAPLGADERECGRCRKVFPRDLTEDQTGTPEWWACEPCRDALFGASSG